MVTMTALAGMLDDIATGLPEGLVQTLLSRSDLRIERIVSLGHALPEGFWYDQEEHEGVLLLVRAARLRFEDEKLIDLTPGRFEDIPAHRKHQAEWTDTDWPTIWLAVHHGGLV